MSCSAADADAGGDPIRIPKASTDAKKRIDLGILASPSTGKYTQYSAL